MIRIRHANLSDASAIARVHVASWQETYPGIVPDDFLKNLSVERRFAQWANSLSDPGDEYHRTLIAELDDQIVGFVNYGYEHEADPIYRGELFAIYIMRSAHRQGIGRSLVNETVQGLLDLGVSSMLVWVLRENPACGFYERLGGVSLREKMIEIGGKELSEVAYGWRDLKICQRG